MNNTITAPQGFVAGSAICGLKKGKPDLAIIFSEAPAVAAGVFTQNLVKAAPVIVSQEHLRNRIARAIVVNSGNANACTGSDGLKDARQMAALTARQLRILPQEVLVCSTGVIGVRLAMERVERGIREAAVGLSRQQDKRIIEAIMTTDTRPKSVVRELRIGRSRVRIGGIAKGAGMIHPNMATLLAFLTTDLAIARPLLRLSLKRAADASFNCISVDGDTSTNDALLILANGVAGNPTISSQQSIHFKKFSEAVEDACQELAQMIVRDGEGARKFVTINIWEARNDDDAKRIARSIANSPLVKTAIAGEDANWGRILAAAGYSGVKFNPDLVEVRIGDLQVAKRGRGVSFSEARAKEILSRRDIEITVRLHQGSGRARMWTCDLTEDYIRINADYRT